MFYVHLSSELTNFIIFVSAIIVKTKPSEHVKVSSHFRDNF